MGYLETALANGISKSTFYTRVHRGWSEERASTEPIHQSRSKVRQEGTIYLIVTDDIYEHIVGEFDTMREVADYLDITLAGVSKAISRGNAIRGKGIKVVKCEM